MIKKFKARNIHRFGWIIFYCCVILKCSLNSHNLILNVQATTVTTSHTIRRDDVGSLPQAAKFSQTEKTKSIRINTSKKINNYYELLQHNLVGSYEANIDKEIIYNKDYFGKKNVFKVINKPTPKHNLRRQTINTSTINGNRLQRSKRSSSIINNFKKLGVLRLPNIKFNVDEIPETTFNYDIDSNQTNNDYGENYFITSNKMANQRKYESGNKRDENKSNLTREQTNFISHSKTSNNRDNKIETSDFIESVFGEKNQYIENTEGADGKRSIKVERDIQLKESRNVDEFIIDEPMALPLRPIIRGPFDAQNSDDVRVVYAEPHSPIQLNCEVDLDIVTSIWLKDGQIIQTNDKNARSNDIRFIKELRGGLTISNVMLEDDGIWQCDAESFRGYIENGRPIKLVVLNPPKQPYLLFDSRRLDAGNLFIPVKEHSELSLACVSEGGNPKPLLTWELLLSPGADRHNQKLSPDNLEIQEIKKDKAILDKEKNYKINSGAKSEAKLPGVYRAHHNARVLCVMEHPSLKTRQNASILLDVQYTPSFAITRTPGFGYPLREGMPVTLKCDVDSNPTSTPLWQKDDADPPFPQTGDGFLNFTSISRDHSGWYKCTSRHLNTQYSSIGYYLSVRYDTLDVTSEPDDPEFSMSSSSSLTQSKSQSPNPFKIGQMDVELGGSVTLHCPQGSLGCWSHLDPNTARLKGLGGPSAPSGQYSMKDVVYQDAGIYKCIGQSPTNKKKLEILNTISVGIKGIPTVIGRNTTPSAFPGSPLHLSVEFCANPPAHAARWLHGDRVYTPGNQYGLDVLAYGVIDLPTPYCKEARLTYVHMHEEVPRTFYFIVSSPDGVAEAVFHVNFTMKYKNKRINNLNTKNNNLPNSIDYNEELRDPEEIQFPIFGSSANSIVCHISVILFATINIIFVY